MACRYARPAPQAGGWLAKLGGPGGPLQLGGGGGHPGLPGQLAGDRPLGGQVLGVGLPPYWRLALTLTRPASWVTIPPGMDPADGRKDLAQAPGGHVRPGR